MDNKKIMQDFAEAFAMLGTALSEAVNALNGFNAARHKIKNAPAAIRNVIPPNFYRHYRR